MIHLIGNAHLDPAWMWPLEEGMEAFAATCRSAIERLEEYPDLIFTCSSAAHYEFVEQTDPVLFAKIKECVIAGRWSIVGGWWVEADCNLPSGEALIRQSLLGQRYFLSRFGRIASVGYNIDSFGHNANLPALLKGAGLLNYVFMRPEEHERSLPDSLFEWRSPGGVSVVAYRLPLHYSNHQQSITDKIRALPRYPLFVGDRDWMLFFGVGNHGGGPTIEQLKEIRALQSEHPDIALSDPERFFKNVQPRSILKQEMNPHAIGAYSAHSEIKRLNRRAEQTLIRAEKMQVIRRLVSPTLNPALHDDDLTGAWKELCLSQFHDMIGGVSIEQACRETTALQKFALSVANTTARIERQRIASMISTTAIQNLVVFNDSAHDRTEWIEFELWHPHASEKGQILNALSLEDNHDNGICCQKIEPSGKIGEDRVRWLAQVSVPAFGWSTFEVKEDSASPADSNVVEADVRTRLLVSQDAGDTWAHGIETYHPCHAEFRVVREYSIESGPLRKGLRCHLEYKASRAEIEYLWYSNDAAIEIRVMLDWHELMETVILAIPHSTALPTIRYEIPYAWLDRPADGKEYPGQSWLDAFDPATGKGLAVANDSKYSFSADQTNVYVTLARSKPFAYHVPPHELHENERMRFLDHGVQECRFLVMPHGTALDHSTLTRMSARQNSPVAVHHESRHAGTLSKEKSLLHCDNPFVLIGAVKRSEEGDGVVIRLIETAGEKQTCLLSGELMPAPTTITLNAFEIQTLLIAGSSITFVDFLERAE
jgi:alpha-mannosidase